MKIGKLKIRKKKNKVRKELKVENKNRPVPSIFDWENIDSGNYDCEVELDENGTVNRIVIDGKDVPKDQEILKRQEEEEERKKRQEAKEKARTELERYEQYSDDAFSLLKSRVPKDTRQLFFNDQEAENFSVKLNRFARYESADKKFYFFRTKNKEDKAFSIGATFEKINFISLATRQRQHAEVLLGSEHLQQQNFQPNWRLVLGLGGASVYETSITLHHVYGFPYIPASSVKGVLRSYIISTQFNEHEGEAIGDKNFCDIFGCPADLSVELESGKRNFKSYYEEARRGKVTFFDALPTKAPTIQPDIMNPHYPEWYDESKNKPPADTQSPVPIYFLTVTNTSFQFLFGSKLLDGSEKLWGDEKTLADWLKEALAEHGIGAKTAVGYGVMQPQRSPDSAS